MSEAAPQGQLERLFAPAWAGGWALARVGWALAALYALAPRGRYIEDAYASADMIFRSAPFYTVDHWVLTAPTGYALWFVGVAAALKVLYGGRLTRLAIVAYLVADWLLLLNEGLMIKAYDRLQLWQALALMCGPISARGLVDRWRSPFGRYALLIVYSAIYLSTGVTKALEEARWWTGDVLAHSLSAVAFTRGDWAPALWVARTEWVVDPLSWFTMIFEVGFVFAIGWRALNPWVLLAGFGMHCGIFFLMEVGPFSAIAVSVYPLLLHPEVARRWWARVAGWVPAGLRSLL